jgi:hypothetical protein
MHNYCTTHNIKESFENFLIHQCNYILLSQVYCVLVNKKNTHLSIENKLLIYKAAIKPIWSYGMELWGCSSKSNIVIMQRPQSRILRTIANTPQYVTNHTLHTDFNILYVSDVIHERINKHHNNLEAHPNPL